MMKFLLLTLAVKCYSIEAFQFQSRNERSISRNIILDGQSSSNEECMVSSYSSLVAPVERRKLFQNVLTSVPALAALSSSLPAYAAEKITVNGANAGNLPDLPPEAVRSYLQYRGTLQLAADFYIFELQDKISKTDDWGEIGQLYRVNNNKGQGSPSRIEREFVNPMRVMLLSMPPDTAEEMRDAQFAFEKAMSKISKATEGIRRDLPVEIDKKAVPNAQAGWEDGRKALNRFFEVLNNETGLKELKSIPAAGPNQFSQYGRSERKYFELVKKTKLCQNRGGPALSQVWGQLMVSGYMQDSCGIPAFEDYFYQS